MVSGTTTWSLAASDTDALTCFLQKKIKTIKFREFKGEKVNHLAEN